MRLHHGCIRVMESSADEYILLGQSFRQLDGSIAACKGWWPTGISVCYMKPEMSTFLVQVQDNASNTWHWFIRVAVTTILFSEINLCGSFRDEDFNFIRYGANL